MRESPVQQAQRLAASRAGARVWRNNVGACVAEDGRQIRYGLCNDSSQLNRAIKSADLIGIQPVLITAEMVGTHLGVFVSIECKAPGARTDPARLLAQEAWRDVIRAAGGYAVITDRTTWPFPVAESAL